MWDDVNAALGASGAGLRETNSFEDNEFNVKNRIFQFIIIYNAYRRAV